MARIATPPRLANLPNEAPPRDNGERGGEGATQDKPMENDVESESKKEEKDEQVRESMNESVGSPRGREKGRRGVREVGRVGIRSSPRSHLKRGREDGTPAKEGKREGVTKTLLVESNQSKVQEPVKTPDRERESKHSRQPKARKVIKYLDGESEDDSVKKEGRGEGSKEQTVLSATVESSLGCVSPRKRASPQKQQHQSPMREGCLVKQPGLTFDKELSASPVKKPPQQRGKDSGQREKPASSPVKPVSKLTQPVSSPVKPVSKLAQPISTPVKQDSKPVKPVLTPRQLPTSKPVTPASADKSTPTPKVARGSSYRNYMNRAGPKAPGTKVIPEGEENCLEGLTFVITGVLESLERDDAADIIKRYKQNSISLKHIV